MPTVDGDLDQGRCTSLFNRLRQNRGWSVALLAVLSSFPQSVSTLWRLVEGKRHCTPEFALPLARLAGDELNLCLDDLWRYLRGEGPHPLAGNGDVSPFKSWKPPENTARELVHR